MDRNSAKADRFAHSQADLETIVEAAKPLYASLDGAQKHKFIALGRMLVPERGQSAKEIRRLSVGGGDQHSTSARRLAAPIGAYAVVARPLPAAE